MFKVNETQIVARDPKKYLSFPDIIKSHKAKDRLFLVYREGDAHHPLWSKLTILVSNDNGGTWDLLTEFDNSLELHGTVWNCPRLSYVDDYLYVICDQKNGTRERMSQFSTIFFSSNNEGKKWTKRYMESFTGMVPDKIIRFKEKLFCANHKIKSSRNDLIQLVSWSKDNGHTWYDTNVVAHSLEQQYCEASLVDMEDHLIAYLRDNSGNQKYIYTTKSYDGVNWSTPEQTKIFGQRVTALKDEDSPDKVVGSYRGSEPNIFGTKLHLCAFEHDIKKNEILVSKIDWEYAENQYHFGYTGMTRTSLNNYIIAYYIKQRENNPYIKLSYVSKIE